jgi:hypothetical protein
MFEKVASPKDSNRLPGIFITGESITNTNNFVLSDNSKKFEIVSRRAYWDQEKLLEEKTGDEKFRDTVPF